jgi:hypothetical protein
VRDLRDHVTEMVEQFRPGTVFQVDGHEALLHSRMSSYA